MRGRAAGLVEWGSVAGRGVCRRRIGASQGVQKSANGSIITMRLRFTKLGTAYFALMLFAVAGTLYATIRIYNRCGPGSA